MKRLYLTSIGLLIILIGLLLGSVTSAASPQPASGPWWADYFDNPTLSGTPILSRYDDAINFTWSTGSPASGLPSDNFSIRWQRDEWFAGGTYRFKVLADDGVRVWVGDQLVIDEWHDRWAEPLNVDRYISAGTYRVRIEYYEHVGDATMSIGWSRVVSGETWYGEYYNCRDMNCPRVLARNDGAIDFDWGTGSPGSAVSTDNFSVRWTRTLNFNAGTYRFLASTDDGVRVWVDGGLVADAWEDQSLPETHTGDVYLTASQHTVTIEYFEHEGDASAHVWWQFQEPFTEWRGEYFDNRQMVGGPVLERNDAEINFDWGVEPPVEWMPDDNFAVRWTREVNFTPGYYRFALQADDGARLWLDHSIIIDKWQDMDYELHYVDGTYLEGTHTIKLEYYEHTGSARVRFWWETGSDDNLPPSSAPVTPGEQPPTGGVAPVVEEDKWEASYFANADLEGEPALTRAETALDHNWSWGSPGAGVPRDHFSARWTRSLYFPGGTYRFITYTDDGVRLWVDDWLLINSWRSMRGYRSGIIWLHEGVHEVRVEYYESTEAALARLRWQRISR